MKKVLLIVLAFIAGLNLLNAQSSDARWAWTHMFNWNHYDGDLGTEIFEPSDGTFGYYTGFRYYLNSSFDASIDFGVDFIDFESFEETAGKAFLSVQYKLNNGYLIKEDAFVKPYLTGGVGAISQLDDGHLLYPFGAGIRFGVSEDVDINAQALFNYVGNGNQVGNYNFFQVGLGAIIQINGNKVKDADGDGVEDKADICPNEAGPASNNGCPLPKDTDGDGVIDDNDQCVNEAGPASNNGCPLKDTDGDGVIDDNDQCVNEAGPASNNGCPLPKDTDGDGVVDDEDDCPTVAGSKATKGCPDSDGDGVADKDDKCEHEAGPVSNNGCPELSDEEQTILLEALEGVQFQTGKAIITRASYSKLDNVYSLLQKHEDFKLKISGYTDNTGNEQKNLELSDQRAKAAKNYIVNKGISANRISAKGYGIANPIATNGTAAGRAKNRRVEFEIEQ